MRKRLHYPLVAILLLAAFGKLLLLLQSPDMDRSVLDDRSLNIALVNFELILACWLLLGFWKVQSRIICVLVFCSFLVFSIAKGIAQEESCNCFGIVEVSPWLSSIVDVAMIGLAFLWDTSTNTSKRTISVSVLAVVCLMSTNFILLNQQTMLSSDLNEDANRKGFVILDFENWIGKRMPIENSIDNIEAATQGNWAIVFYHDDCVRCSEIMRLLEVQSEQLNIRICFISLSPNPNSNKQRDTTFLWLELDSSRKWFAETPVIVLLNEGKVVEVHGRDSKISLRHFIERKFID